MTADGTDGKALYLAVRNNEFIFDIVGQRPQSAAEDNQKRGAKFPSRSCICRESERYKSVMAETFIGKAARQKLLQRYGLANAVNVGKMNQHPGDGKFFQPLPAGAARGDEILSVGNDDDFNDFAVSSGNHCRNGSGFGTGSVGVRDILNVAAGIHSSFCGENGGAYRKAGIRSIGAGKGVFGQRP